MPAGDVLLPSHGAETPICQPPRQHVGRHPGEGTLPAARGLTAVNEVGGHAARAICHLLRQTAELCPVQELGDPVRRRSCCPTER
eukprot:260763-Chlamydomonas_euryale.AAC.1